MNKIFQLRFQDNASVEMYMSSFIKKDGIFKLIKSLYIQSTLAT